MLIKMNRAGHVPTWILLFCGIVLMVISWFTFLNFGKEIDKNDNNFFVLLNKIEFDDIYSSRIIEAIVQGTIIEIKKNNIQKDNFIEEFRRIFKEKSENVFEISSIGTNSLSGNLFGEIRNDNFLIEKKDKSYELLIKDVFINREENNNLINRKFDIFIEFDENKIIRQDKIYK